MVMIRQRMQKVIEESLCNSQYGFRPQRSTSHALYIIRRIQDFAEIKGTKLSMAMLDREKTLTNLTNSTHLTNLTYLTHLTNLTILTTLTNLTNSNNLTNLTNSNNLTNLTNSTNSHS